MQCCYIGKGTIYARLVGSAAAAVSLGNCSKLELQIEDDVKTVKDYESGGGGIACSVSRINGINVALSMNCLSAANIAKALFGTTASAVGGAVVDQVEIVYPSGFVYLAPGMTSVVVKHTSGTPVYTLGTDYTLGNNGIVITAAGAITSGQSLKISYTKPALTTIELLTSAAGEYELSFDGLNEMESGSPTFIRLFKFKFGPAKNFGLIGDDPTALECVGKLNKDTTKTGTGISQYAKMVVQT